jgi:hypothetical protein
MPEGSGGERCAYRLILLAFHDGVISACPAINWHRFLPADLWPQVVMVAAGNFVPKAKLDAATAAAVASGDALDGVR